MKNKILLTVDYHSATINAFKYAQHIAKEMKSELILLHAFHVPLPALDTGVPIHNMKEVQKFENKRIERFAEINTLDSDSKIKIKFLAIEGLAGDVIPDWIKKNRPDLVIMGIHETNALDEFLMGSTCERIIDDNLCPVLIIPIKSNYKRINKISFASDFQEIDITQIGKTLRKICNMFKCKLELIHAVEANEIKFKDINENIQKLTEELLPVKARLSEPETQKIANAIEKEILKNRSQWLVLVHKKYGFLKELFHKSVIKKLISESDIPVMVLNNKTEKSR
ncbi:MAG: universal stress protein [Bacteroidota bacterium]